MGRICRKGYQSIKFFPNRAIGTSPYVWKYKQQPHFNCDKNNGTRIVKYDEKGLKQKRTRIWDNYQRLIVKGSRNVKYDLKLNDPVLIYKDCGTGK